MGMTHRFDFKPKVSLPTACSSCKEEIQIKDNVALVNGEAHCFHCTNIASYQDYAFYRAQEKVVIKQFFDILISLIFGIACFVFAYFLAVNDPLVSFMPRFLVPYDLIIYEIVGSIILFLPFIGFIARATKYGLPNFSKVLTRLPKVMIYPDYGDKGKLTEQSENRVFTFLLAFFFAGFLSLWSPILMIIRLVQYLNYGAKINRIDDQYIREHKGEKKNKDFNLYVKHASEEQKLSIDKIKLKFGKYPKAEHLQDNPEFYEVRRNMRLFIAYRLRYKLEKELIKKYPKANFIFVVSKN